MTKDTVSNSVSVEGSNPGDTATHPSRGWLRGKLGQLVNRGLLGGLGTTLFALPAMAQATDAELDAFQFVDSIPGVRSATLLDNGDVRLKMSDGRTVVVAAENVQILDNGAVMIADAAAVEIAQFAAVAEAGAAAAASAGGIGGAGLALGGLGLAGAAAAAGAGGGGGGDDDDGGTAIEPQPPVPAPPAPRPPSLNLAELQADALNEVSTMGTVPEGTSTVEVTIGSLSKLATPAPDGSWSVSLTEAEAIGLAQGTTDVSVRALDAEGAELAATTKQFLVDTVPPTLSIDGLSSGAVMNTAEQGENLTVSGSTDAESGQIVTVSLAGKDYTAVVSGGTWSVNVPAADLAVLPDGSTIAVTANVSDRAGNPAAEDSNSFVTDFSSPTLTLDPVAGGAVDLIDVSGDLVLTGSTTAEDGQLVSVTFNGQNYSGTASSGRWSVTVPNADLASLETGTPVAISATVNDAAGNPANAVTTSVPVDLTGPSLAIAPLSVGDVVNAAEAGSDLTITGTTGNVTDGQVVTVTLDGQTYQGNVTSGAWSVTLPSTALGTLADGGEFAITADVTDADGLVAPQASVTLAKDATPPVLTIDAVSAGTVINAQEQTEPLTISGSTSAENGQMVSVAVNGKGYAASVSNGSWSATIPASDLASFTDGATITVSANVADQAGNPALQADSMFTTDFTAPAVAISPLSTGALMNSAEQAGGLVASGTSDAVDGTQVTIMLQRADGTVDVTGTATVSGGNWTYTASGGDLSGLQDNESYSVNASVSDAAGNQNSVSTDFDTDFAAPAITLNTLAVGDVLDVIEQGSDLGVSGTTTAEDGQTVSVLLGGQTYTAVVANGGWSASVPSADLAALADSTTFTVTASVQDAAGNPATDATTSLTTDFSPILRIDPVGSNDAVSLNSVQTGGLTVTGNSVGLNAGQSVNVTLNSVSVGTASISADGSWSLTLSGADFSGLTAGDEMDFSATAVVSDGPDPAPASQQVFAHEPAAYVITEASRSGSTITFQIYADPDRDVSGGLAFDTELHFDPAVVSFDGGSVAENDDFNLFLSNPVGANQINFAGAAASYGDLTQPVVSFTMTVQDASQPIVLRLATDDGGPSEFHLGTANNDTLTGSAVDDVFAGGAGNDTIDLSGSGRDVIALEANPTENGVDTILGFSLGTSANLADALSFRGLDPTFLRGSGADVEILNLGDNIGVNTGFLAIRENLSDLDAETIASAAEGLKGAGAGDEIYVLATDGEDSVLTKVDYAASDDASAQVIAQFEGLSDLGTFSSDNVLISDPTGASA